MLCSAAARARRDPLRSFPPTAPPLEHRGSSTPEAEPAAACRRSWPSTGRRSTTCFATIPLGAGGALPPPAARSRVVLSPLLTRAPHTPSLFPARRVGSDPEPPAAAVLRLRPARGTLAARRGARAAPAAAARVGRRRSSPPALHASDLLLSSFCPRSPPPPACGGRRPPYSPAAAARHFLRLRARGATALLWRQQKTNEGGAAARAPCSSSLPAAQALSRQPQAPRAGVRRPAGLPLPRCAQRLSPTNHQCSAACSGSCCSGIRTAAGARGG